jgi:hypothetical protein
VKLQSAPSSATPASIPAALASAARTHGHAPALTVLLPHARFEQSFASLAQWTAKGAHLLESEVGLRAGDTVGIDAPMSWPTAAVALSAWWLGLTVLLEGEGTVTIRHERRAAADLSADFWIGDGFDGGVETSPSSANTVEAALADAAAPADAAAQADAATQLATGESWPLAVQHFPDQPPTSVTTAGDMLRVAATSDAYNATQLLEMARAQGSRRAGLSVSSTSISPVEALVAITLRPLVTGWTTVMLDGVSAAVAAQERVSTWLTNDA